MITVALAEKEFSVLASNFIQTINQALRTFVISGPLFYLNNLKVNCCYISTNATRRMSLLHPHIAPQSWTDTMIQLSVSNGFIDMQWQHVWDKQDLWMFLDIENPPTLMIILSPAANNIPEPVSHSQNHQNILKLFLLIFTIYIILQCIKKCSLFHFNSTSKVVQEKGNYIRTPVY